MGQTERAARYRAENIANGELPRSRGARLGGLSGVGMQGRETPEGGEQRVLVADSRRFTAETNVDTGKQ